MKWTLTVAVVSGFVLAMALAFGGRAENGPHLGKVHKECFCCGGKQLPWRNQKQAPETGSPMVLPSAEGDIALGNEAARRASTNNAC